MKKKLYDLEKRWKDTQKLKMQLESEARNLENDNQKEMQENYHQKMALDKGEVFGVLNNSRFERDLKLNNDYKTEMTDQLKALADHRARLQTEFNGMADLQVLINDGEKFKEEIEDMHVKLAFLVAQIKMMEDGTDYLQEKKELLDEQKKTQDESNEDLEKQVKAKEETNMKRLQAKLARDKNPVVKDLIAAEEQQVEANEDFQNKLRGEYAKHDTLTDELIQVKENLTLTKAKFEENTKMVGESDTELAALHATINTKQNDVNAKQKVVDEARKVNHLESEKNKNYTKANAALKAKLDFIETKYDYSSTAKQLSLDDFKELIASNVNVNSSMGTFTGKLDVVQKEIQTIETMKQMMI